MYQGEKILLQGGEAPGKNDEVQIPLSSLGTQKAALSKSNEIPSSASASAIKTGDVTAQLAPKENLAAEHTMHVVAPSEFAGNQRSQVGDAAGRAFFIQNDQALQTISTKTAEHKGDSHVAQDGVLAQGMTSTPSTLQTSMSSTTLDRPNGHERIDNWQTVISQVSDGILSNLQQDNREARLQLAPPELGKIDIQLVLDGERIQAHIVAESADVGALIQTHLPELKHALQSHRLDLDTVRVDIQNGNADSRTASQHFQRDAQTRGRGRDIPNDVQTEELDGVLPSTGAASPINHRGKLNVWA
jgi:flagellar hook-length control protein FliK